MTSKLANHVLTEINKIEIMLRKTKQSADKKIRRGATNLNVSNIDIDHDPDIVAKRQELAELDKHYGTAWRRFKTALLENKQKINENVSQSIIVKRAQCISLLGSNNLFVRANNQTTTTAIENQQHTVILT
jgi:hypothetical protein